MCPVKNGRMNGLSCDHSDVTGGPCENASGAQAGLNQPVFARIRFLQRIGRAELVQFFRRFEPQLRARQLSLPGPHLPDPAWREALGRMLRTAEALPAT